MQSALPNELPQRLMTIGIEVYGRIRNYTGLNMYATGTKFDNENPGQCEVKISNLDTATRDFIGNETSPFNENRTPKRIYISAGYASIGEALLFVGDITKSDPSQPPDITLTIQAVTKNFEKGNIISRSQPPDASLSTIAKQIATDLGSQLTFQATDKQVSNYNFTGAASKQMGKLNALGQINAYIDNNVLVVKDLKVPLVNRLKIASIATGMVGTPEMTELGVKVKMFIDNQTVLGGALQVISQLNPSINGNYIIYKLSFEVASRDTPFYWIAEAARV